METYIYGVLLNRNCDGDGSCRFQMWKDKIKIFEELTVETITPKIVREQILLLNKEINI